MGNAPLKVVTGLHKAYPKCVESADDRQMLPIHLCCRVMGNINVAKYLLFSNVSTLNKTDYRGRTPLKLLLEYKEKNLQKPGGSDEEAKNRDTLIKLIKKKFIKGENGFVLKEKIDSPTSNQDNFQQGEAKNTESALAGDTRMKAVAK